MSKYYKVPKDSETGKKLIIERNKINESSNAFFELATDLGATGAMIIPLNGQCTGFAFDVAPDLKVWKYEGYPNIYFPKGNSKAGKAILARINEIPQNGSTTLNKVVGVNYPFSSIGCQCPENGNFYGISCGDKLQFTAPSDCIEITCTEYGNLSKQLNNE